MPTNHDRLIYFADTGLHAYNVKQPATADQFARHMDDMADNGIDIYSQLTFAAGALKPGLFMPEHPDFEYWPNLKLQPLIDSGVQPLEVMIDQAHRRGMKFYCKLRLTDWHRLRSREENVFIDRHPELQNPDRQTRRTLDYSHPEVWQYHAALVDELARRFDIDGITLNFVRGLAYFPKDATVDRRALLTEFVKLIRSTLDEQAKRRGRPLQMNAIVWPHLEQCGHYDVDVASWIREGLFDHICPGNTHMTDPAMNHEAWSALCRDTSCRYFPILQPLHWQSEGNRLIEPRHIRALLRTMDHGGADGVSVFNWQFYWDVRGGRGPSGVTHGPWSQCRMVDTSEIDFPMALTFLRDAHDPTANDREPRTYCFRSMEVHDSLSHHPFEDAYRVVLPRETGAHGAYRFVLPEQIESTGGAWLVVRILGLSPIEEFGGSSVIGPSDDVSGAEKDWQWPHGIELDVNDTPIAEQAIQMTWHRLGRLKHQGKPLPPYTAAWFRLETPPTRCGWNTLGLTLRRLEPLDEQAEVTIEEVEITVLPKPWERSRSGV